jgi:hypothetical protein
MSQSLSKPPLLGMIVAEVGASLIVSSVCGRVLVAIPATHGVLAPFFWFFIESSIGSP